jgi:hypothetical protein
MFPSNPSGIDTHQNFPHGCPPQVNGQHFVPTPDFSDQQRNIRQTSGHYAPNHNERQHGPIFQNRVWNRLNSQNISGESAEQTSQQKPRERKAGRSRSSRLRHQRSTMKAKSSLRSNLIMTTNRKRLKRSTSHIREINIKRYGFVSNPKHPLWKNKQEALRTMDLSLLESRQPSNATLHNLSGKKLPCGSDQLLGLSLKFCIQETIPKLQVAKTIARLRRAVRLQAWLDAHSDEETEDKNDNDHIPGLYLSSTSTPPLAPTHIENGLSTFEGKLNDYFEQRRPNRSDNLTCFPMSRPETTTSGHLPPRL